MMVAPNLNNPTKVEAKLVAVEGNTSSLTLLSNAADSNKTLRVVSITADNIDGTNSADATLTLNINGTATDFRKTIAVPADSSLVLVSRDSLLYLPENCSLNCTASANGDIVFHASYEEIT